MFEGELLTLSYLAVDAALAAAFFRMSRGSWFPSPLFFLHLLLVIFHLYSVAIDQSPFWMLAFLNRTFELALIYIVVCALYRIRHAS